MTVSEFRKAVVKMKTLENKCMLITYSDSMGHNLMDLERVLSTYFKDAVGGVHILPFSLLPETGALHPWIIPVWILLSGDGKTWKSLRINII